MALSCQNGEDFRTEPKRGGLDLEDAFAHGVEDAEMSYAFGRSVEEFCFRRCAFGFPSLAQDGPFHLPMLPSRHP